MHFFCRRRCRFFTGLGIALVCLPLPVLLPLPEQR